jgi:RNA polymerase sigma factor (sigma-70 family)
VTNDCVNTARFESTVIPLLRPLYLRAVRMTSSLTDAEDLLQETVLKAYASRHSFNPETNLTAWMHRIMANTLIDDYRKAKRRPMQHPREDITDRQLVASAARWQGRCCRPRTKYSKSCPTLTSRRRCCACPRSTGRQFTSPMLPVSPTGRSRRSWVYDREQWDHDSNAADDSCATC